MRIIICDDDTIIRNQLTEYLKEFFAETKHKVPEIATFSNGSALLADQKKKDIVFLDVAMPDMTGIDVGKELKKNNPNIIIFIVTSFMEYLDDAMRFQAFRYLSKPLDKQRLFHNLKDAISLYNTSFTEVYIETKDAVHNVSSADIVVIECQTRKVIIHTLQEDYETTQRMSYWVQKLQGSCFYQTHKSFLVNMKHVTKFDDSMVYLCGNRFQAYLTKRNFTAFKRAYALYMDSMR